MNRYWTAIGRVAVGIFAALSGLPFAVMGATSDTTELNAAMKIIFDDAIINNVVMDTELLSEFEDGGGIQSEVTTGGRYIETAQLFNLPAGVGARGENDYIPEPTGPTIVNGRITLKKMLGSVEMTADVMKKVRSDEGAFVAWAERALPSLVQRLTNEIDRILLGYGNGAKARVDDATPALALVVDNAFGLELPSGTPLADPLLQFLAGETLIASPNADGSTPRVGAMTVDSVDWAAASPTLNIAASPGLAAALADDDYLFAGDAAGNSADKEAMGLLGIVDDGSVLTTFQNISRSTYPQWAAPVIDAQAAPFTTNDVLTEKTLMYADDVGHTRAGSMIDFIVASRQGMRQMWSDLQADRAINDPSDFTGGKRNVFVLLGDRTVRIRAARKMPGTLCFGLTRSTFRKYMLHEWEWNDLTGSIWKQVTDATGRKDAFYAYGSLYMELANTDPAKNWRIENITDASF